MPELDYEKDSAEDTKAWMEFMRLKRIEKANKKWENKNVEKE